MKLAKTCHFYEIFQTKFVEIIDGAQKTLSKLHTAGVPIFSAHFDRK
jgi:hypothetical protein